MYHNIKYTNSKKNNWLIYAYISNKKLNTLLNNLINRSIYAFYIVVDRFMATQRPLYGHTDNNKYTMAKSLKTDSEENRIQPTSPKIVHTNRGNRRNVSHSERLSVHHHLDLRPTRHFFGATVKYAPYFTPNILEDNRSLRDNNAKAVVSWRAQLKNNIFGSNFWDSMINGFNEGLAETSNQIWLYTDKNPHD